MTAPITSSTSHEGFALGVSALEAIDALVKKPNSAHALDLLALVAKITSAILSGFRQGDDPEKIKAELASLGVRLASADRAADDALDAKFDHER